MDFRRLQGGFVFVCSIFFFSAGLASFFFCFFCGNRVINKFPDVFLLAFYGPLINLALSQYVVHLLFLLESPPFLLPLMSISTDSFFRGHFPFRPPSLLPLFRVNRPFRRCRRLVTPVGPLLIFSS